VALGATFADAMGAVYAYVLFSAAFYLGVNTFWGRRLALSRPFLTNMGSALAIGALPVAAGSLLDVTSAAGFAGVTIVWGAAAVLCLRASGMTVAELRQLAAAR
jgi:hypothetical protein